MRNSGVKNSFFNKTSTSKQHGEKSAGDKSEGDATEEEGAIKNFQTIHFAHENFNMVFNIMLGIKKAVDATLDMPLLKLTTKDFNLKC